MWKRKLFNPGIDQKFYVHYILFTAIFFPILLKQVYAKGNTDTIKTSKENILLSIFPDDCIEIYHLPENRLLNEHIDSVSNKFKVYSMGSRARPGLAKLIFDKLSEARIDDSMPHITFHITFRWEGHRMPYKMEAYTELNCDTLGGLFSREMVASIVNEKVLNSLHQSSFVQPLDGSAEFGYNSAVIAGIDAMASMYDNDRTERLYRITQGILIKKADSLNALKIEERRNCAKIRVNLRNALERELLDSLLFLVPDGMYVKEGMSSWFNGKEEQETETNRICSELVKELFDCDCHIQLVSNELLKIEYLLKDGSTPLHSQIKSEFSKLGLASIDIAGEITLVAATISSIIEGYLAHIEEEMLKTDLN